MPIWTVRRSLLCCAVSVGKELQRGSSLGEESTLVGVLRSNTREGRIVCSGFWSKVSPGSDSDVPSKASVDILRFVPISESQCSALNQENGTEAFYPGRVAALWLRRTIFD